MTQTMQKKNTDREYLSTNIPCDRLTARKDGTFELRQSYFSVDGYDSTAWAEQVVRQAGNEFSLVDAYCGLKHFVVVLRRIPNE